MPPSPVVSRFVIDSLPAGSCHLDTVVNGAPTTQIYTFTNATERLTAPLALPNSQLTEATLMDSALMLGRFLESIRQARNPIVAPVLDYSETLHRTATTLVAVLSFRGSMVARITWTAGPAPVVPGLVVVEGPTLDISWGEFIYLSDWLGRIARAVS